jgi:hypothetical protein
MLLKLPLATATFSSPARAVLPYPTWVKPPWRVFPGREQLGVLQLEVLYRHGRCSGHRSLLRVCPRSRPPRASGPPGTPVALDGGPVVRYLTYILYGYHRTVRPRDQSTPGNRGRAHQTKARLS